MPSRWSQIIGPAQRHFRSARAKKIVEHLPQIRQGSVIDIGGSLKFWRELDHKLNPARVTCYNLHQGRMHMGEDPAKSKVVAKIYDGKRVPEEDQSADVVICNSVIEHVPLEARKGLAGEISRVGRSWMVQTPSPLFPLELHFGLPFVHWLPRALGRIVVRVSPFHLLSGANGPKYFDETRLLSKRELMALFPSGQLVVERVFGIPKSYLVFGGADFAADQVGTSQEAER